MLLIGKTLKSFVPLTKTLGYVYNKEAVGVGFILVHLWFTKINIPQAISVHFLCDCNEPRHMEFALFF